MTPLTKMYTKSCIQHTARTLCPKVNFKCSKQQKLSLNITCILSYHGQLKPLLTPLKSLPLSKCLYDFITSHGYYMYFHMIKTITSVNWDTKYTQSLKSQPCLFFAINHLFPALLEVQIETNTTH